MNRRNFLTRLLTGTAALAVVPTEYCNSLCSFWCTEHTVPPGPVIESYMAYTNFSKFAIASEIDKRVAEATEELGAAAGRNIAELEIRAFA